MLFRSGRHLLPDEMREPGFVSVAVGQHWVAGIAADGTGHAFGHMPGWELAADPINGLLLAAKLAREPH